MGCKKCNGYWQCSDDDDPCGMTREDDDAVAFDVETRCIRVFTKKTGSGCRMRIACGPEADPTGWDLAGEMCFKFEAFEDAASGKCFVKVTDLQPT